MPHFWFTGIAPASACASRPHTCWLLSILRNLKFITFLRERDCTSNFVYLILLHLEIISNSNNCTAKMGSIQEPAPAKKLMNLNFFDMACAGSHMPYGQWK
jgi:hypothetical protein